MEQRVSHTSQFVRILGNSTSLVDSRSYQFGQPNLIAAFVISMFCFGTIFIGCAFIYIIDKRQRLAGPPIIVRQISPYVINPRDATQISFLKGSWIKITKLPNDDSENLCAICFSTLINDDKNSKSNTEHDFVNLNPMSIQTPHSHILDSDGNLNRNSNERRLSKQVRIDSPAVKLPCGHMFHETCITVWADMHNDCPLCRRIPEVNSNVTTARAIYGDTVV